MYVHVLYQRTSIGVVSEAGDDSRASSSGKSVVLCPLKVPQSTCSTVEMRVTKLQQTKQQDKMAVTVRENELPWADLNLATTHSVLDRCV